MSDRPDIVPIPVQRPTDSNASLWVRLKGRVKLWVGGMLRGRGGPGFVRSVQVDDAVTGWTFKVDVGGISTTVSVDGRNYVFDRFTGKFIGTGYANRSSCRQEDTTDA